MAPVIAAEGPGLRVLHVDGKLAEFPFVSVRVARAGAESRRVYLPALRSTDYLVRLPPGSTEFSFDETHVSAASIRRARPRDLLRAIERPRVAARLRFVDDGLSAQPLLRGTGAEGRALVKAMRALARWGFGIASTNLQRTPELLFDLDAPIAMPQPEGTPRFVVALHLFYVELWPEFEHFLRRIGQPFHLIVTGPAFDPAVAANIRRAFPTAELIALPNRGRDVGPFLQLLHDGRLDGFEFVLKLHGKRTALTEHHAALGHVWRRASIIDLAGSDETVRRILSRFDDDATIGMIGSSRFRVPGQLISETDAWGKNRTETLRLAGRLGIANENFHLDYFAGTMFWARRQTLEPLRRLNLSLADFPDEHGQRDGELHHAMERLFGSLPGLSGQRLESAPPRLDP